MSNAKEIRTKIKSIKNTQKITKAMEMVAASKMRRAQERMFATKPYAKKIREVVAHLACGKSEFNLTFLKPRAEIKRVGLIVVTTDRGLCGGLNVNLLKNTFQQIRTWRQQNIEVDLCLIGTKGETFFRRFGGNVVGSAAHLGDKPELKQLIGIISMMLKNYEAGKIDALYLSYNDFVNTMTQRPRVQQLLPIAIDEFDTKNLSHHWDYIYEPDSKSLVDMLIARYIESQVYQAVVENVACEQAARMVAMKNATENAGSLINELQLAYNKARQAAITQELAEIIAGASAV
ncbi:MAG: atpG [Gammaproteobacteria bacterium]|jgi:F-type H+-transporting ATPase subunit gamma|nr:atpG [Gammaproteobacteria bacterium]